MLVLNNDWDAVIGAELRADYMRKLSNYIKCEYASERVYPPACDIFNALRLTPFGSVRIVILGQDPYHGEGQAHGLAFSVCRGTPPPPSLVNIFKEIHDELGTPIPSHGCLEAWARQGVLLLNTALTVREGQPASHSGIGWERFTDFIISALNERPEPIVFMLWGAKAGAKSAIITNKNHLVLKAPHPSPLSVYRGFSGCGHFTAANDFMALHGFSIDWTLD